MLGFADEPLPAVPHTGAGGPAAGPLRARPVCMEPGGGAAVVVAAGPPGARIRRAVPAALRGPRRLSVAGDGQRDRPAAGAAGLPRRLRLLVRVAAGVAHTLRHHPTTRAPGGTVPAVVAEARTQRGLPDRRRRSWGCAAPERPLERGARPEARLGQVPLVPPGARHPVLPGPPGPRPPLACCLRGGPAP